MAAVSAIKAKFEAEFGADPALWEQFQEYLQVVSDGIFKEPPVPVRDFFCDKYFCADTAIEAIGRDGGAYNTNLYPEVLNALEAACSGQFTEAVLTGGIGVSKSTVAVLGTVYSTYQLSLMWSAQETFGLLPSDEVVIAFQSITSTLAKAVDYARFSQHIGESKYFQRNFKPNPKIISELQFPGRIVARAFSGSESAAISQNILMGILDEVNFMQVVENSKQALEGGVYDQAQALYNAIHRRRTSRFESLGQLPGMMFLVSSKRYPGEFTDRKMDEARAEIAATGKTRIFVYDKKIWEVQPHKFCGKKFNVFTGDEVRSPRILEEGEELPPEDAHLLLPVPIERRSDFDTDILSALRDIGGTNTSALNPYILATHKVGAAFGKHPSCLTAEVCDFASTSVKVLPKAFLKPEEPRFVHLDLAKRKDSAGVACGFVVGFEKIIREGEEEHLPIFHYDFILEVKAPKGGEIEFAKIRSLLYLLRGQGLNIRWVTADSYQSTDTIQILRKKGFITDERSVDVTPAPYNVLKASILESRCRAPKHDKARHELVALEQDGATGKIDHPPHGSKDCSDAMAGVAHGLFTQREVWARHGMAGRMPGSAKPRTGRR